MKNLQLTIRFVIPLCCAELLLAYQHTQSAAAATADSAPSQESQVVVAADGSGDYQKVQDAINAVPKNKSTRTVIFIKPGTYKEKIRVSADRTNLSLIGESYLTTTLTYDDYAGKTPDYASTRILCDDFFAQNLTFRNTIDSRSGIDGGQAAALRVDGDRAVFYKCRISGFQDTYYTGGNKRSYHKDCIIEGTTDFIYGDGIALFEDCTIYNRKNSHITAHSQKLKDGKQANKFGYVFQNCKIKRYPGEEVSNASLGRPWGNAARVVYLNCSIGSHIRREGWSQWRGRENHNTAYYAEYKNRGPGSKPDGRLPWTHQLTEEEAAEYTKRRIFRSSTTTATTLQGDWNPEIADFDIAHRSSSEKPRVIVTSDGEIDDECSLVRFLLYANEWDIEGIVTSSSQYHWQGHKWAGDDWAQPYLSAYSKVQPNLLQHDSRYPTAEYLQARTFLGNVKAEGDMEETTPGSQHIVRILLDESDDRPIWLQAWGGPNTIARALKTIEDEHPEKMAYVANKIRFFFIWEQDETYQSYIRPHWGRYEIPTIISDQFWAIAYQWNRILPADKQAYFKADWMKSNILKNHGALCSLYKAHVPGSHGLSGDTDFNDGDFRSEGDSPAFLHAIPTGLRSTESPGFGGWGGRYKRVRSNTWLDPVPDSNFEYPEGRWYTTNAWGRTYMRDKYPQDKDQMRQYFKPLSHWTDAIQNDFASRADWCVNSYDEANHPPVVVLAHSNDLQAQSGTTVNLRAEGTSDPDGDELEYRWWQYREAGSYVSSVEIQNAENQNASLTVPDDAGTGQSIHMICEVTDSGTPRLTRYQRVVVSIP